MSDGRTAIIIAGPNGAGKTTFALEFLPNEASCPAFVNADLLAAGLNPLQPQEASVAAGRLMLGIIRRYVAQGRSFAFETTLSGRTYASMIPRWQAQGYRVALHFLTLPSSDIAIARVRKRAAAGGHDIPEAVIRRRFEAGRRNLETTCQQLVDAWYRYDSSGAAPVLVASSSDRQEYD